MVCEWAEDFGSIKHFEEELEGKVELMSSSEEGSKERYYIEEAFEILKIHIL